MTAITASTTLGISLTSALYTDPISVAPGVSIAHAAGPGIFGATAISPWTIQNSGNISGYYGLFLTNGGSIANGAAGVIHGYNRGILVPTGSATVTNAGTISGTSSILPSYGTDLLGGGTIFNQSGGVVIGSNEGIHFFGHAGTVVNYGSITALRHFGSAIHMKSGGVVSNAPGGSIVGGYYGIKLEGSGETVVNASTIAATAASGSAVYLQSAGSVTNTLSASITGHVGVFLYAGGTVTNAGTIGGSSSAVRFGGSGNNLLIVNPGAQFNGQVIGGSSGGGGGGSNKIELTSGASAGMLNGLGSSFTQFGSIAIDSGADWFISTNTVGLSGTIGGFNHHDTLEITGLTETIQSYSSGSLFLTGQQDIVVHFSGGAFSASSFTATPAANNTDITVACFAGGTRIATAFGNILVEDLRVGDRIEVMSGKPAQPIVWIGHRHVDCTRHPRPETVWPVRVSAHAFGPGLPQRDLFLSPDHAIYFAGTLIPIKYLANASTIVQVPTDEVTYYHLELPQHDVLLADGLPTESYLDTGCRSNFENFEGAVQPFPDFANHKREADGYAPLVVTGPLIAATLAWVRGLAGVSDEEWRDGLINAAQPNLAYSPSPATQ